MHAICILQCNMDSFLLKQKGLESMSILPKKNLQYAYCALQYGYCDRIILPLTDASGGYSRPVQPADYLLMVGAPTVRKQVS